MSFKESFDIKLGLLLYGMTFVGALVRVFIFAVVGAHLHGMLHFLIKFTLGSISFYDLRLIVLTIIMLAFTIVLCGINLWRTGQLRVKSEALWDYLYDRTRFSFFVLLVYGGLIWFIGCIALHNMFALSSFAVAGLLGLYTLFEYALLELLLNRVRR